MLTLLILWTEKAKQEKGKEEITLTWAQKVRLRLEDNSQ